MNVLKKVFGVLIIVALAINIFRVVMEKKARQTTYSAKIIEPIAVRKMGIYEKYVKRILDIMCAMCAIVCFSPIYMIIAILVKVKLGSPVLFTQDRPGLVDDDGRETIFKMYKFRTMTNEKDEKGKLLPDDLRMTRFGKWLRSTSLDELPEAFNILNGTMSIIGPRPQLVRDLVFMNSEQRKRHTAKPGLSGLAQIRGRNAISWDEKLMWDQEYIKKITIGRDIKIVFETILRALIKKEGVTQDNMETAEDFGDYLLKKDEISIREYELGHEIAEKIMNRNENMVSGLVSIIMPSYNTCQYIRESIESVLNQSYTKWELIIIDDCSTDDTENVLLEIKDDRIVIIRNKNNLGAALSRNKGLQVAKGQWIAFLDSDDIWTPDKLKKQIQFMEKNGYSFSYTKYEEIDNSGKRTNIIVGGPHKITRLGMMNYCWPGCLTVMYDAEKIGKLQIKDVKKNNDYAMWLKVSKKADCYLLDECCGQYRRGRVGSISSRSIYELIGWHYKLFRYIEEKNVVSSVFCTGRNLIFGFIKKIYYVKRM